MARRPRFSSRCRKGIPLIGRSDCILIGELSEKYRIMLPHVHDHGLIEYRVNLRDRRVMLITRPPATQSNSGVEAVATVFQGLEAHHFERVSSGVILFDISQPSLVSFLQEHEREFSDGHRLVGAPSWWRGTVAAAEVYLRDRGARVFEIHSSYGFSDWILASSVTQCPWAPGDL